MEAVYDPKKVMLNLNGITVTGFGDGDKIKIEPVTKEDMKSFAGIDGDVTFARVNDDRHTVTFTLKFESPANKLLDGYRKLAAPIAVVITNTSGGKYLGGGIGAYIAEKPSDTFGADAPLREWKLIVPKYSSAALPE